jgi:hypothetical protein
LNGERQAIEFEIFVGGGQCQRQFNHESTI